MSSTSTEAGSRIMTSLSVRSIVIQLFRAIQSYGNILKTKPPFSCLGKDGFKRMKYSIERSNLRNYKPEAVAMNVHDLYAAVFFKVFTQLGNVYVHTTSIEIRVAAPYPFQCGFAGQ